MINELYEASTALERANIQVTRWHRDYKSIAGITKSNPCIRVTISDGKVKSFSTVEEGLGPKLRTFGDNHKRYPIMNLAPLYRVVGNDGNLISKTVKAPESIDDATIARFESFCRCKKNNWTSSLKGKYQRSINDAAHTVGTLASEFQPLQVLLAETDRFQDSEVLHHELGRVALRMLRERREVGLALRMLFHIGDPEKDPKKDCGKLVIAFESKTLLRQGFPVISGKFTEGLNADLIKSDARAVSRGQEDEVQSCDAFGFSLHENEMSENPRTPKVKLAGGLGEVTLRTMFEKQECQRRYNRFNNETYPVSLKIQNRLADTLFWLAGSKDKEDKTWTKVGDKEILCAFSLRVPDIDANVAGAFNKNAHGKQELEFKVRVEQFLSELKKTKEPGTDSHSDHIQLFILKKIDKARTKIVYSRMTNAGELERRSEEWTVGCRNIPSFPKRFGKPMVLFPFAIPGILNKEWKQDGTSIEKKGQTESHRAIPAYHGLDLLLDDPPSSEMIKRDIRMMVKKTDTLAGFIGTAVAKPFDQQLPIYQDQDVAKILALLGLLLYRVGSRKDSYMDDLPYLYGQLLRTSDQLHALYCEEVRSNQFPQQFAGSSMYQQASEAPIRALGVLGQRMNPYISWARTYRYKSEENSWKARWLLDIYESISTQLKKNWQASKRLNDEEKAQLFIGYLAKLSNKVQDYQDEENNCGEEESQDEQ